MSNRRGAKVGLERPRETEAKLLDAEFRSRRAARKLPPTDPEETAWLAKVEKRVAWMEAQNPTACQLLVLWETTRSAVFLDAWKEMRRLGLIGGDIDERLCAISGGDEFDKALVAAVEHTRQIEGGSQEQAMERVAVRVAPPASTLDGAVQSIKRAKLRTAKARASR